MALQEEDPVEVTRRRLMQSLRTGVPQNPDQLAQDRAAAAERGVSVQTLRAARDQGLPIPNQNWHALPVTAPRTSTFLSRPENAAVAHDDVETLARIERNMREYGPNAFSGPMQPMQGDNTVLGWMRGIGTSFTEGFALSRTGLQRQLNDYLVGAGIIEAPATDQYGRNQYDWRTRQAQGRMALARPEIENDIASGIYGGLESTARATPGLALSILTRNPTPSLVAMGLQTEGEAYAKYRERGATVGEATVGGVGEGAVEVLTEMLPMGFFANRFGKEGALAFIGGVLARELPGELAATMAQDALDTAIANPDKTWAEYWAERPGALSQTAIATVTQSLLMAGASATVETLANRSANAQAQSQRAESGARMVEQLGVLASASKLNAREAQTFQQFVDMAAEDGDVTDVYIASETLFQSANETDLDLDALAAAVPHVAEQIRSGASDIRMTVGEYTAHVAGTQANAALLDHLRTDPLGMSRADAREQLANLDATVQQDFDKAFERSAETEAAMASRDAVAAQIARKLNATGRFTSDVNQRYGMIVANFYATLGARRGMSAEQLAEIIKLDFDAELPGTSQDNTLSQEESVDLIHFSDTGNLMASDPKKWGATRATQNSERERRNAGAPGRTYFGVKGVYQGEGGVGINRRRFQYQARVPASKLYDFDADPQGLKPSEGTPTEIATAYEKAIQAAGFSGYRSDALIPGAVAVFDAVELTPAEGTSYNQTATVRGGRETLKKFGLDPNKRYSTRQVAAALEARQRAKWGKIDRDDQSPEAAKKIAGWMAEEVMFEMQNPEQSGVGWYSYKFQAALDIFAQEFPELATDQDARDTFTALIAITSDGQKVIPNFQQAVGIYRAMKENGQFVADQGTQRQASVDNNLSKIQEMFDTLGPAAMREFLLGEMTVSELKKKAKESGLAFSSSYKSDVKLPMAAVLFGPKLGAFYANLMGADGYLTMDRWWSRTFNRYRGTILTRAGQPGLDGFKKLIGQPDLSNDEVLVAILAPQRALEARKFKTQLAVLVGKSEPGKAADKVKWFATARERAGDRFDALLLEHKIERAANTLFKAAFVNLEDQPFNAGDRSFMLEAVALARKSLKRRGVDISVADIQAVLWYYEKRLYGELGARQTADVSYEEAARRVVDGRPIDAELLGPDLDSDWEDTVEQSDPGLQVFNQGPAPRTVAEYFSPENIGSLLEKDDWAILTAANPQGNEVSAEENEKALAELAAELDAMGVDYQPSQGKYQGTGEPGFTIVGITEAQARALGEAYDQHSVLTPRGLIYQDGRVDEAVGVIVYDTAPTEDFYTEIPGTGVMFALDIPALRGGDTYNQSDPFYSALERAVEQSPLTKAPAAQWMATLSKTPGVKKEEIEITGLQDYLDGLAGQTEEFKAASSQVDAKGNITKEAVLGFVRANGVQLEETVLGAEPTERDRQIWAEGYAMDTGHSVETGLEIWDTDGGREQFISEQEMDTQFGVYKLPGADDTYREILLSLPDVEGPSTHWDKQNVVAHARITGREDAAGKRVLFIEELQSDWHQKGRDQGYQQPADPVAQEEARLALAAATAARDAARTDFAEEVVAEGEVLLARLQASQEKAKASLGAEGDAVLAERIAKLNGALNTITDQLAAKEFARASQQASFLTYNAANGLGKTEAMQAAIDRLEQAQLAALEAEVAYDAASGETGIPDAPWKKSWDALLMKRMIRYAVDNGFEQIAWINGNQQNGGQTGGDGSFFYERNLVNTTNDIIKKFGTRVEKVNMRPPVDREKIIAERAGGEQIRRDLLAEDQAAGDDFAIAQSQDRLASWLAETEAQLAGELTSPYITASVSRIEYAEATGRPEDAQIIREEVEAERARLLRPATSLGIQNGFTITPELRDAAMSGFAMFQQNRGQIAFGKDISQTPSVISLLKTADLSTFLHETGHFFLEATLHLANMPDADAVSVADANILLRWFAPDMTLEKWAGMTLEEKTPYHERFARGFEAYLFEGKAPSTEMRSLFRTFSSWLKSVYKSLTELNVELTDDVRGVMDRMLASEAEIEDAQQVWALSALYDQKPEGMTEDEWARLQALGRDATEEAVEQLERRSVRDMKWASGAKSRALRQLQDEAEELRKAIRAEVTAEVMAEPLNRARNFLRRGLGQDGEPVENAGKLDLATLKALYGDEPARPTGPLGQFATPPEGPLWTKLRRGGKYGEVGTDGLHPDIVAGWFGYPSGEALIEDLVNGENAAEKIKGLTDQRMLERHGDLTDPQSIDKAANEAVANEARVKFVAAEEAYAAKAAGKKSLLAEAAKAIADRVVSRLTLKNLKPAQYISAQIRASRAARKAATKGDAVGVATAKRTQLINLHTGRAVAAARKEVEKDLRLFARIVTAKDASLARSRNMDLVNAARAILAKYGVGRVKNDVAGYIKAVQTYDPELFADLASVFGDLVNPERPLNELTYGEYVAVRDAVRQLWQQSRQSKVIEIDGQQRTIESVVGELNAQMDEVQPNADVAAPETTPSKEDRRGHEILGVRAMLRRVESWARGVDVRAQGPFTRYIWNPISEASDRYRRDSAAYLRRLNALMETMREDMKPRDIAAPELGFVFKSKAVLYHAMLHTGNLSNKTKLLLGYGWGKKNEDGTLDDSRWQAFMDRLHAEGVITERDWAFVQSVWDLLEETKPGAQRAHHIMYGRYFDEITADPVVTPFGTLRGGYVPALTESYFVQDAMLRSGEDGLESNAASQMFPSAGNGFTKGREENYTQPLSLELGLLPAHLDKVVKFTHLGPAVRQAMRLLKNRALAARLKAFDPTAQTDLLLPWLQRAAKQTVESQGIGNGGKWVDRTARYLRGTVGMQLMFANVINTAQQVVGGPFAAAVRVKPSRLGQAHWRFMRNPAEVTTAATNLSTALAVRMDNQIMETRQNINEIIDLDPTALGSARSWAIRHGYFMQSAVQNVMDPIIWTAAFDQATSEGQSTADAVRFADSVLRETQGSWNPEDVSRLETGSPFVRMFTQFGGWANMLANLNATETQIVARGVGVGKGKGRLFYVYLMGFAAQALVGQAIADLMRGGWDDDEEDGYLDEALNWFFGSQLKLGLSSIPIAGPLANVALGGFTEARFDDRLSVSPVLSVVEGGLLAPASVYDSVVNGEKFNRADVRNVLTLLGLVSGLPLVPLAKPLGYAADVVNEDVEPTGPLDAARGVVTGAPSPESRQ